MEGKDDVVCKRCSHCGSADLQLVESALESGFFVCCLTCEACGPSADSPQLALEKWCQRYGTAEIFGYTNSIGPDYLS